MEQLRTLILRELMLSQICVGIDMSPADQPCRIGNSHTETFVYDLESPAFDDSPVLFYLAGQPDVDLSDIETVEQFSQHIVGYIRSRYGGECNMVIRRDDEQDINTTTKESW